MSTDRLLAAAEVTKLARQLAADEAELDFLRALPSASLQAFRDSVTDLLFAHDADRLGRVAAGSRLVPVPVAARAAEMSLGPMLCAAVAGAVDVDRGVAIASRLRTPFLAETAAQLDPRRAEGLLGRMPADLVVEVAGEMSRRGDHITMGRFVAVLPDATLAAAMPALTDADLLKTGFLLEDKSRMDALVDLVRDRMPGIIQAAHDEDMWSEALFLLALIDEEKQRFVAEVTAELGEEVLDSLLASVQRLDAWDLLVPITLSLEEDVLAVYAGRPVVAEAEAAIRAAAERAGVDADRLLALR